MPIKYEKSVDLVQVLPGVITAAALLSTMAYGAYLFQGKMGGGKGAGVFTEGCLDFEVNLGGIFGVSFLLFLSFES